MNEEKKIIFVDWRIRRHDLEIIIEEFYARLRRAGKNGRITLEMVDETSHNDKGVTNEQMDEERASKKKHSH